MLSQLTFPLAGVGFALLAVAGGLATMGKCPRWLVVLTAAVILTHVGFVWQFRYEWSFAQATRNGYFGFALFHTALLLLVIAALVSGIRAQRNLLFATFLIVCVGANGAVYRYDVVALYRIPVHAVTLAGIAFALWGLRRNAMQKTP